MKVSLLLEADIIEEIDIQNIRFAVGRLVGRMIASGMRIITVQTSVEEQEPMVWIKDGKQLRNI